jgi:hypothetical protein
MIGKFNNSLGYLSQRRGGPEAQRYFSITKNVREQ